MKATITGIGVVGGFGCGVSAFERAAADGTGRGIRTVNIRTGGLRADVPGFLADPTPLAGFLPRKALRRIDHFTRLALLGGYLALEDAGLDVNRRGQMGIIFATGYGSTCDTFDFINNDADEDNPCCSPIRFANSVHSAAAAHISSFLGVHGPTLSINQHDMSVPLAFLTACQWLEENRVDTVLVGGADEFSRAMGLYRQQKRSLGEPNTPFGGPSTTTPVGEGSAFFVLEKASAGPDAYAHVRSVEVRSFTGGLDSDPPKTLLILNPETCRWDLLTPHAQWASYGHLYGSLPVGSAFDIAMAAIMLNTGKRYPSGAEDDETFQRNSIRPDTPKERGFRDIECLQFGSTGDIGLVRLAPIQCPTTEPASPRKPDEHSGTVGGGILKSTGRNTASYTTVSSIKQCEKRPLSGIKQNSFCPFRKLPE